jgi:hypothetical protein
MVFRHSDGPAIKLVGVAEREKAVGTIAPLRQIPIAIGTETQL